MHIYIYTYIITYYIILYTYKYILYIYIYVHMYIQLYLHCIPIIVWQNHQFCRLNLIQPHFSGFPLKPLLFFVKCHQIQFNHIISYLSLFLGTSQCPPFLCPIRCSSPRFHWVRIGVQRPTLRWLSLSQKWGKPAGGCLLKSEFTSNNRDFIKHKRRVHCTVMAIYQL